MEPAQLISEEWDSLSGQYTAEEADFMNQFLSGNKNTSFGMPSYFPHADFMCFSQGSSTTSSGTYSCDLATNFDSLSMFFCLEDAKFSPQYLDDSISKHINNDIIDHKGSCLEPSSEEDRSTNMENPAKRFRSSLEVSENTRNVRKCPKSASMSNNEEGLMWNGTNNRFSHVDSIGGIISSSLSPKEHEAPKLGRKSRAASSPATDAQSIYARKRRERINERLRILQTLVPNGTKVDFLIN
ncbi:transcription factor [Medicago truncatula]|uniref:Transcription factor n=1 Tax=Medicago truncatula TaxID=3880 RepID=A0A072VPT2_MEDTR|nr:transcription factor [Medicago truncatula]